MSTVNQNSKDYLIVGCGIAGLLFVEQLIQHQQSFTVIDGPTSSASMVAGGLYNPVVLKRFRAVWKASYALSVAIPTYERLEALLQSVWLYEGPIYRRLANTAEFNKWITAADQPELSPFLSVEFKRNSNSYLIADSGFGQVLRGGRLDVASLLVAFKDFLKTQRSIHEVTFDYDQLEVSSDQITYEGTSYKHLIFAEGMGVLQNPYFNSLPIQGNKGEYLKIYAPQLKLDAIYKSDIFIIPLGDHKYLVGATYDRFDQSMDPTSAARQTLADKLKALITCDFDIIGQLAGIRPTVPDRRPVVGTHPQWSRIHILNGLGSRGVLHGPMVAKSLYDAIAYQVPIDAEIALDRFTKWVKY